MIPPTLEEVTAYCDERGNGIDPEAFIAYYEARGWMLKNGPVKKWQACVITWENGERQRNPVVKEKLPSPDRVKWAMGQTNVEPIDDWRTA